MISSTALRAASGAKVWVSSTDRSGLTSTPPLKPAMAVSSAKGSIEHRHAARRPPRSDGQRDPGGSEGPAGPDSARGQEFVLGDEGPIDVGQQQANGHLGAHRQPVP